LINIVLSEREKDVEQRFHPHIHKGIHRHFKRVAWEEIYSFIAEYSPEDHNKRVILEYFRNKTIGYNRFGELQKAFKVE
jgi:predicted RNA-binding protein